MFHVKQVGNMGGIFHRKKRYLNVGIAFLLVVKD
ncbi:hypothetical protein LVISKB_2303 [Levilactobacillus brevis KB290]|uniref:Uncharacterized protein n=1 Tax=Levilactobacillus brevis KB290 TaxID=1001583 RepID=M5AGI8_LEVBR|nr:hypothetical protein LVISKB_2303 [Levilactobacillus brevis KB290]